MDIGYLEIVTPDVDAVRQTYAAVHGVSFSGPVPELGGAWVAQLSGGGRLGIRGPLRPDEVPVVRPYLRVDDVASAVAAARAGGAEIAIEAMPIPGHGTIGIFIQGGIESGVWEDA